MNDPKIAAALIRNAAASGFARGLLAGVLAASTTLLILWAILK